MQGFAGVVAVLVGLTAGISGAYTVRNILFPSLPPLEDVSSLEELVFKNILIRGIVQAVEEDRFILAIEGLYSEGEKMSLTIKMSDTSTVRSLVPHLSPSGAVLFWEERGLAQNDIAKGLAARVSLLRQPGELQAVVVTLLPS